MGFLTVSGICKKENGGFILSDIQFTQFPGQKIAIAGETGSGKTTLLKMIAGLDQPDTGEIVFRDQRVKGSLEQLIPGHPQIAYLSQHFELRNNYYVHEILAYANELPQEETTRLYDICRISHLLNRRTDQLSGGEKQRIALARLLSSMPSLLLLDEPFSNLDAIHKSIIQSVIKDISSQLNISIIMVSHDAPEMLSWADTILLMKDGRIIQEGDPSWVYFQPASEYCAALLGDYNLLDMDTFSQEDKAAAVANEGKKIFTRPGSFTITTSQPGAVECRVLNIAFLGNYYLLDVKAGEQFIRLTTTHLRANTGDMIYIKLSPGMNWYL